ncbi:SDR family NAD(P)-dependent oxidoreductase [Streptomyces malaysiensis]|uniref:SDR family NAD(P)-dependent oxidoreductase n=1 Tax=Streptomyces malaysiensis TaxID=92644 RepID=UPI0011CE58D7|nr:SDR family oxidoreductase [Streptomyces malaysiensis]
MAGRLADKVALITGIGSGIGRAAAQLFAAEGARVAGCGMRPEGVDETVRLVTEAGGSIVGAAPVDLGEPAAVTAWVDEVVQRFGRIDVLYNNAGSHAMGPFGAAPEEDWRMTMRNDLDPTYLTTRAVWPTMCAQGGGGVIINTASIIASRATAAAMSAHGAAKGAVAALTPHLAVEGGPYGIRVNTLSPGITRTGQTEGLLSDPDNPLVRNQIRLSPLGRVGAPEDVANLALFLASDESSYITGTTIVIDGGQTLSMGMSFEPATAGAGR